MAVDTGFSNWRPGDGDGQRNNEFVSLQKNELKALAVYPLLGAIAAKLTRSSAIRDRLACGPGVLGDLQLRQDDLGVDSTPLGGRHAQSARGDGGGPSPAAAARRPVLQPSRSA